MIFKNTSVVTKCSPNPSLDSLKPRENLDYLNPLLFFLSIVPSSNDYLIHFFLFTYN